MGPVVPPKKRGPSSDIIVTTTMLPRSPPLRNPARSLTARPTWGARPFGGGGGGGGMGMGNASAGRDSMEEPLRQRPSQSQLPPPNSSATAASAAAAALAADMGLSPARWGTLTFLLLLSLLFSLLDTTIVSTSLLEAAKDLANYADSSWVMLAYLLTYMGFSIIFAKMSDIFGRLAVLMTSWTLFTAFSIGCGVSKTMPQLIIMRAFQGIGGAGLYSLPIVCLHEIVPPRNRQMIGGFISIILSISFVLGPILGGVIPQFSSWRVLYLINIPFGVTAALGLFLLYPRSRHRHRRPRTSGLDLVRKIDFLGALALLAGSMLLVFAVQEAGSMKMAWESRPIIATLCLSGVCWVFFWGWEAFLSLRSGARVQPVFPLSLAGQRVYLACLLTTLMVGFSFMTVIVTLPERSQVVDGDNVLMAGVNLLPLLGAVAVGSFAAGPVSRKENRTAITIVLGTSAMTVGAGLLTTLEHMATGGRHVAATKYSAEVLLGLGSGLCLASATMMSTAQARGKGDLAVANGATAQTRVLGSALGLGVWTIIFNAHVQASGPKLSANLNPAQLDMIHRSPANVLALQEPARSLAREIYSAAFTDMMLILVVVSGGSFVASLCCFESNPPQVHPRPPPMRRQRQKQLLPGSGPPSEQELQDLQRHHTHAPRTHQHHHHHHHHHHRRSSGGGGGEGGEGGHGRGQSVGSSIGHHQRRTSSSAGCGGGSSDTASHRDRESFDVGRPPTVPRPILPR